MAGVRSEQGGMVRVATLLQDKEGRSQLGKPIARLAAEAEAALEAITESGRRSVEASNEIASAAQQQGATSHSIAQAVERVAQAADALGGVRPRRAFHMPVNPLGASPSP